MKKHLSTSYEDFTMGNPAYNACYSSGSNNMYELGSQNLADAEWFKIGSFTYCQIYNI